MPESRSQTGLGDLVCVWLRSGRQTMSNKRTDLIRNTISSCGTMSRKPDIEIGREYKPLHQDEQSAEDEALLPVSNDETSRVRRPKCSTR